MTGKVTPPYTGSFHAAAIPDSKFSGQNAQGDWYLVIEDVPDADDDPSILVPENQWLLDWSLDITKSAALTPVTRVNTTASGNQEYSSVAMSYDGAYTVAWSGNGNQPNQVDTSGVSINSMTPPAIRSVPKPV